ncbi:HTH domain-containing protein [Marinoscillum sp. MHG1-6]|uniref:HTH domain-containing protein n=1 Tax=Marinoscillum sp. MHG1-6 TaxID=2959627 RepID=UPI0035BE42B3
MDYFTYSQRLDYLLELITKERLSSPKDLESQFDCTERTVRKMINDLRRKGYVIRYSRECSKYILDCD